MKKILLLITTLFISALHAELSPVYYMKLQNNAPEFLVISVTEVQTDLIFSDTKSTNVKAKVLIAKRSESGLKRGDIINIVYNTAFSRPEGWVGPSSIPVLKKNEIYRAFLKKYEDSNTYEPAARGKSFK